MGLDSHRIEDSLHVNVVNAALGGATGLKYLTEGPAQYFKDGDIIVNCMEYNSFSGDRYWGGGDDDLFLMVNRSFEDIKLLDEKQKKSYVSGYFINIRNRLQEIGKEISPYAVYNKHSFNDRGDKTLHWGYPSKYSGAPSLINKPLNVEAVKHFANTIHELRKTKTVILLPGNCGRTYFKDNEGYIRQCIAALEAEGISLQCDPLQHVQDDDRVFDFPMHFNKKGVDLNTAEVIRDLKALMPPKE